MQRNRKVATGAIPELMEIGPRLYLAPVDWWIARDDAQPLRGGQFQVHIPNGGVKLGVNRRVVASGTIGGIPPNVLNVGQRNILSLNVAVENRLVERVAEFHDNV